jgi:hypothetical protein
MYEADAIFGLKIVAQIWSPYLYDKRYGPQYTVSPRMAKTE